MELTITLSWWVLPLALTVALFAWAFSKDRRNTGGYGVDLMPEVRLIVALIASLFAWLIWALLT